MGWDIPGNRLTSLDRFAALLPSCFQKIDRFLQLLGIYDDRYQTLSSYSKGMRQKVLLIAAVLHNPRIVILDEPFSGLDVSAARVLKGFEYDDSVWYRSS